MDFNHDLIMMISNEKVKDSHPDAPSLTRPPSLPHPLPSIMVAESHSSLSRELKNTDEEDGRAPLSAPPDPPGSAGLLAALSARGAAHGRGCGCAAPGAPEMLGEAVPPPPRRVTARSSRRQRAAYFPAAPPPQYFPQKQNPSPYPVTHFPSP